MTDVMFALSIGLVAGMLLGGAMAVYVVSILALRQPDSGPLTPNEAALYSRMADIENDLRDA